MKTIFYVQWFSKGKWSKTYFGREKNEFGVYYYNTPDEALEELIHVHNRQKDAGKKPTRYRILAKTYKTDLLKELP